MAVNYMLSGATTDVRARVVAHTGNAGAIARLAYSVNSDMSSPEYSAQQTIDANGYVKFNLLTLTPGTQYYYRLEIAGAIDTATTGKFKTHAVAPGNRWSFRFAWASCSGPVSATTSPTNHPVWARIADDPADFFFHIGDLHYQNINSNNQDLFRSAYQGILNRPNAKLACLSKPWLYIYDDHDYGANDANRTAGSKPAVSRTYRQCFPHVDLALPNPDNGVYYTYTAGRVRFIVTDQRYYRDPHTQAETTTKRTMLGSVQKQWFKDQITAAANDPNIVYTVWMSTQVPYADGAGIASWGSYTSEMRELWDHFEQSGIIGRLGCLSGDIHASVALGGYDYSTNGDAAGVDLVTSSPIEQYSLYAGGAVPVDRVTIDQGQYAAVDVIDTEDELIITVYSYTTSSEGVRTLNWTWELFNKDLRIYEGDYAGKVWDEENQKWVRKRLHYYDGDEHREIRKVRYLP